MDTVTDFIMMLCCLIKLIPVLHIPAWLIFWLIVIAAIKAVNLISGYALRKEFIALHTVMNMVTGILMFFLQP